MPDFLQWSRVIYLLNSSTESVLKISEKGIKGLKEFERVRKHLKEIERVQKSLKEFERVSGGLRRVFIMLLNIKYSRKSGRYSHAFEKNHNGV